MCIARDTQEGKFVRRDGMKHFFTPSQRLQDKFDMFDDEVHDYFEVELAVSIQVFLNHRSDWSDFLAFSTDPSVRGQLLGRALHVVAIPIYSFDFFRRMSRRLFARMRMVLSLLLGRSARRDLDLDAAPVPIRFPTMN
jgi:hypothetical protein